MSITKRVAVLGNGMYGVSTAVKLVENTEVDYQVTLFALNHFAVLMPSGPRAAIGTYRAKTIAGDLAEHVDKRVNLKFIEEITEFDQFSVTYVAEGDKAKEPKTEEFDFIVVATGSQWSDPFDFSKAKTMEGLEEYIEAMATKVKNAKKIVVVGGGESGIELAGEIGYKYRNDPSKEIILVHSKHKLYDDNILASVRDKIQPLLEELNVKVILNNKVDFDNSTETSLKLSNGDTIDNVDCYFKTVGATPNIPPTPLRSSLVDDHGHIKINEFSQTLEYPNIFALGDVNDLHHKSLMAKKETLELISYNITQVAKKTNNKLKAYSQKFRDTNTIKPVVATSVGPEMAVGHMALPFIGSIRLPAFLLVRAKSKNLFADHLDELFSS